MRGRVTTCRGETGHEQVRPEAGRLRRGLRGCDAGKDQLEEGLAAENSWLENRRRSAVEGAQASSQVCRLGRVPMVLRELGAKGRAAGSRGHGEMAGPTLQPSPGFAGLLARWHGASV